MYLVCQVISFNEASPFFYYPLVISLLPKLNEIYICKLDVR